MKDGLVGGIRVAKVPEALAAAVRGWGDHELVFEWTEDRASALGGPMLLRVRCARCRAAAGVRGVTEAIKSGIREEFRDQIYGEQIKRLLNSVVDKMRETYPESCEESAKLWTVRSVMES